MNLGQGMSLGQRRAERGGDDNRIKIQTNPMKNGASEGIRTLDVHLGKVMLYQTELRSLPKSVDEKLGELSRIARPVFSENPVADDGPPQFNKHPKLRPRSRAVTIPSGGNPSVVRHKCCNV